MSGFNGAVEGGVLHGYDVVNNLTSTSTTTPLSANMGKVLNDKITPLNGLGTSASSIIQIKAINTKGTLGGSFAARFEEMSNDGELKIFKNSNQPSDAPSDNSWGGALIMKIDSTTGVAFSFSKTYFGYSRIENGAIEGWIKLS